ncbi:hypothetical protein M0802_002462 [Mischocyttarus mexicanus]|nr:hypothetical protein M0802_002462 [Mischocyttarus mexicanus]
MLLGGGSGYQLKGESERKGSVYRVECLEDGVYRVVCLVERVRLINARFHGQFRWEGAKEGREEKRRRKEYSRDFSRRGSRGSHGECLLTTPDDPRRGSPP